MNSNNVNNNGSTESSKEHNDGILELDNDLPNWWLGIFVISIVFSVAYMFYYHMDGGGTLPVQEYLEEQKKIASEKSSTELPGNYQITGEDLSAALTAPAEIASGKQVFDSKCIACHAPGGAGSVGPNLTDEFWIHGGNPQQVANIILKGVPEKGMIAWATLLQKQEVISLVAYIKSIHGSNPPNAKAPQGVRTEP